MNAIDYEVLKAIYVHEEKNQRALSELVGASLGRVNKSIRILKENGYLDDQSEPTSETKELANRFRPRSAVILAAGHGLRMIPLCRDIPKAFLEVKGEILIERLIRQLQEVGIEDISIVVGYMKEKFEYLMDKYHVKCVVNKHFDTHNNLFSLHLVSNCLCNSYVVPCDIYCETNPFSPVELYSWYMMTEEADPSSRLAVNRNNELCAARGQADGRKEVGIAYFCDKDCEEIRSRLQERAETDDRNAFWENAVFCDKMPSVKAKWVKSENICEINTYDDLIRCDAHSGSLNSEYIDIICRSLRVERREISHMQAQKAGMTNRSFLFRCNDAEYIFRIPGEGSDKLINRRQEYAVYQQIADKHICDDILYINPENGYKITRFIENAQNCDPLNTEEVKRCMQTLRAFHEMGLKVEHSFDIFEQLEYYEALRGRASVYEDYEATKQKVLQMKAYIDHQEKDSCLCHIDSVCDNFIFSKDRVYLIDWEYAGMQDPHVDIAMFAIYALYDKAQADQLIDLYFQGDCSKATRLKIYCYIAACGLLWSNWCEYKATFGETFGEYSLCQYRYAKDFYRFFTEGLTDDEVEG